MKIKVNKKIVAFVMAGVLATGATGIAIKKSNETENTFPNEYGHETNLFIENIFVDDDDFILLDVGNHDDFGVLFQNSKMNYINKKDNALGIIINSDACDEESIYDDVEFVKGIVRDHDISFPVYLNIDSIITNDDLNIEMKTKIIKDFLEKCSANNIYVGLCGTDTNLCRVRKYCDITSYDAYLIQDEENIKYKGTYNVVKDLDGNIHASANLAETINNKKLNEADRFFSDSSYKFKSDDDITDVALRYGMSVNELLSFNGLKRNDLEDGTILRIPCNIEKNTGKFKKLDEPIIGCDISYAQAQNSDWEKLHDNFEFIILKCSQGTTSDQYFESNASNCNINNIPIGAYCYNGFNNQNCEDDDIFIKRQKEQANYVLSLLKNKRIDYPVYLDIECAGGLNSNYLTSEQVNKMLNIWKTKVEDGGFVPGIYCNQSGFEYLQSCVDYDLSNKFQVWIAGGDQYYADKRDINIEDVEPSYSIFNNDRYNVTMAQSTDSCVGAGSGNGNGHLDIDYSMIDYSTGMIPTKTFEIKEYNRLKDPKYLIPPLGLVSLAGIGFGLKRRKNIKKKTK